MRTTPSTPSTSPAPVLVAPCGCTFQGRFYNTRGCTVLDQATVTGHDAMRHAMAAEKQLKAAARKAA